MKALLTPAAKTIKLLSTSAAQQSTVVAPHSTSVERGSAPRDTAVLRAERTFSLTCSAHSASGLHARRLTPRAVPYVDLMSGLPPKYSAARYCYPRAWGGYSRYHSHLRLSLGLLAKDQVDAAGHSTLLLNFEMHDIYFYHLSA